MYQQYQSGWLEVICGCMFAGKTEELIRRLHVLSYAEKTMAIFKPAIDNRYSEQEIVSHAGNHIPCYSIREARDILKHVSPDTDVVAVDEVQFFDMAIVDVLNHLAKKGIRVMAAGLDMDFRGVPFPVMSHLLGTAEFVTKLTAICSKCGAPATRSQRFVNGKPADFYDPIVLIGASESYEARCRHCHDVPGKDDWS